MAKPKNILVLDLGMQSLRLAEFSADAQGVLDLIRGDRRDLMLDPSLEQARPEEIRLKLLEIVRDWKIRGSRVICVLPAHAVFTRVVPLDLPGGTREQIAAIVGFEAQQHIPFPLAEVVWDYVLMGKSSGGPVNVAFVAIRTNLLESLCKAVGDAGLRIVAISVAPFALYDAFRSTYPEAGASTTLLLDFGSRTTNMVIAAPDMFFSRNIPSGGLAITSAIAKELHVELTEAEQIKVARGFIGSGGTDPSTDSADANLAKITRQALLRTQADIARSLSYYRSNLNGGEPDRIVITGGMSSLPGLSEFLSEKFHKEVTFFRPLRNVPLSEREDSTAAEFIASNPNNLGELIGGALTLTPWEHTGTDLLPPTLRKKREFLKRLPHLMIAATVFLGTLSAWSLCNQHETDRLRKASEAASESIAKKTALDSRIRELSLKIDSVHGAGDSLLALATLRAAYPSILAELAEKLPPRFLWMTEISPLGDSPQKSANGKPADSPGVRYLSIKGLYLDNPRQASVIDDFVNSLQSSPLFAFEEKDKSKVIMQRVTPNGEFWAYPFSLKVPLKTAIAPLPRSADE